MCVYGRVLAGRGRDPVQNNGTAVECGAAGNILSQTQGKPRGLRRSALWQDFYKLCFYIKTDDTKRTIHLSG